MTIKQLQNLDKKLIIVTGISSSGKSTLSHKLSDKLFCPVLSMDDYKVNLYEKYGFKNNFERKILWERAKYEFQTDIIIKLRNNEDIIVEYPFDVSWQNFFTQIAKEYGYTIICIYCNSRKFDDIWKSRIKRDENELLRPKCLTASSYIKDKLYISNNKLNNEYKEEKQKQYLENKYTSIIGDYIFNDIDIYKIIKLL